MADKFTAAESIRRLAVMYSSMIEAADALEAIGSIERVTEEQKKQADAATAEADKAKADLAKVKEQIKVQAAKGDALVADAVLSAKIERDNIVKAAEETAANVLKKAQDESAEMIAKASTEKARLSSEIGGLQAAIEAGRSELVSLKAAKEAAEAATVDAEKKLDGIKGKLKALLG